jgi:sporulation protein YlmC with PRC-barrel domain
MLSKNIAMALLTTALMTGVASAQSTTNKSDTANVTKMHREGEWRATKLAGVSVYNESNEKIGDVNDVILDKSGKATNVILGVGGFLGMGEHYVAVTFDQLKWVDEGVRSTTASTSTAPASGTATNVNGTCERWSKSGLFWRHVDGRRRLTAAADCPGSQGPALL